MKYLKILSAVWLCAGALFVLQGCSSLTRTNYKAVGTAQVTVEQALTAWNQVVKAGHATIEQEKAVKRAVERYRFASLAVIDASAAAQASANSTNGPSGSPALNTALAAASASLGDLVALIQSFGVKI